MPVCSICHAQTPSGRFCSECGAPFMTSEVQKPPPEQRVPPRFQEQMSFEERDQKALLYQQPGSTNPNAAPSIPVVYVDGDGAADRANNRNMSSASSAGSQERGRGLSSSQSGILKGRYSDHPNCDVCGLAFDVTKRRHQWCVRPASRLLLLSILQY
jgi:hypothetical protein